MAISEVGEGLKNWPPIQSMNPFPGVYYLIEGLATLSIASEDMNKVMGYVFAEYDWIGALSIDSNQSLFFIEEELEPV